MFCYDIAFLLQATAARSIADVFPPNWKLVRDEVTSSLALGKKHFCIFALFGEKNTKNVTK
jgi:hypothetical protein